MWYEGTYWISFVWNLYGQHIEGISNYNDSQKDGAETIAEGFVALRNGAKEVPKKIKELVEHHINPCKKVR